MDGQRPRWSVAVFAHNEAQHIVTCLQSIAAAAPGHQPDCYVLINGSRDNTEQIVRDYAKTHPNVHAIHIELGDKSNAWNLYVHELAPEAAVHFFLDGDCVACPDAMNQLAQALEANPQATAAAAVPFVGRHQQSFQQQMVREHGLAGNLYALRGSLMARMRAESIKIPVGMIGEDSMVGMFVKRDLDPRNKWDNQKIVVVPAAGFAFKSLSFKSWANWKLYWRRRIRYSVRGYQLDLIKDDMKHLGLSGIPEHVNQLYRQHAERLVLKKQGLNTLFNWLALKRIRAALAAKH